MSPTRRCRVDDRDRWQGDAPANGQCDALPARSRALRGRAKPLVEVTIELHASAAHQPSREVSAPRTQEVFLGVDDRHACRAVGEHAAKVRSGRREILNGSVIRVAAGAPARSYGQLAHSRHPAVRHQGWTADPGGADRGPAPARRPGRERSGPARACTPRGTSPVSSACRAALSPLRTRSSPPRATWSSCRARARGSPMPPRYARPPPRRRPLPHRGSTSAPTRPDVSSFPRTATRAVPGARDDHRRRPRLRRPARGRGSALGPGRPSRPRPRRVRLSPRI